MAASLSTPGVAALLSAWEPQLQQLHQHAAATHGGSSPDKAPATSQQYNQQQPQQEGDRQAGGQQNVQQGGQQAAALSLAGFLEVLQGKGVIPQLLEPSDVQEVLRQLLVTQQQQVRVSTMAVRLHASLWLFYASMWRLWLSCWAATSSCNLFCMRIDRLRLSCAACEAENPTRQHVFLVTGLCAKLRMMVLCCDDVNLAGCSVLQPGLCPVQPCAVHVWPSRLHFPPPASTARQLPAGTRAATGCFPYVHGPSPSAWTAVDKPASIKSGRCSC